MGDTGVVRYRFDDVVLDTSTFELVRGGRSVPVEPQVFEVLAHLVENRDRLVPRTELLDTIWGDRFVSDSALASRVKAARAAIGDDGRTQRCIRTVHGRGLQFVAPVIAEVPATGMPGADAPTLDEPDGLHQSVGFVEVRGGVQLAVAEVGTGRPLVKAANWLTHVEYDWRSPVWRHWITELGRRFRFLRYDSRGCGLSDHDFGGQSMTDVDVWTDDLEAVVDDAGVERFVLLGMSQGSGPAMAYAVRHPERVSHLVLYGGYARGVRRRGATERDQWEAMLQLMRVGWGGENPAFRSVFTMTFMPKATSEQIRWFDDLQRRTTDAEHAVVLEEAFYDQDFTGLAAAVRVPTLVVHGRGDQAVPYEEGRHLAASIPDAEFVTLDSANHILTADEPAWAELLGHLDRFTAG